MVVKLDIFINLQMYNFWSSADIGAENISNLILEYATSIPNLAVSNFSRMLLGKPVSLHVFR